MNKNILKFGLIPLIIVLVAFSYVTLADDPELAQNSLGVNEETIILLREATSQIASDINPEMGNVIAFDISNGQDTNDFADFIDDLEIMGYTVATIDITTDGIPDNVEKLIISSASQGNLIDEAYTTSEAILLEQWVADGGELLILAENELFIDMTDELCLQFGITQNANVITDTDDYYLNNIWVIYEGYNLDSTHQILYDVNSVVFLAGCSFDTTDGVIIRSDDDGTATPLDAPAAIAKEWGDGRVAIFGDYNWISSHYDLYDNSKMAINTILWLNGIIMPPPGATSTRLLAGQDIYVGDVYIWNDNDDIHVLYRTFDDWYLLETHFDIKLDWKDIPQNKQHNPQIGHFEFFDSFDITEYVQDWHITFPIPDDMEYGDDVAAAAHAVVAHIYEDCIEVISDETTQSMGLTSGKPDGDSVFAWEHPAWSAPKSQFTSSADWIWESEYVFNPEIDNWVFFTKEFMIPGLYPIELLGDIKITCDNEYYDLMLNWQTVGSDDVYPDVETYDISDKLGVGVNEIEIMAKNLGVIGSTVETNPGGLIYESFICFEVVDQEETAWGEGIQFTHKKSWAMWFEYTINWPPVAVILPEDESFPWCEPVPFDGTTSYDVDGVIVAYYWDFGDGTTSFNPMPSHIYPTIGTYTVTLTVMDDQGATDTTTTTVTVYNTPPVADFSYIQDPWMEWCEPIDFIDASYDPDICDTLTYLWDFGDGGSSTEQNPTYTYTGPGTFTVTLTVTDGYGATDTATDSVLVENYPPTADFDYDPYDPYWCDEVEFDGSWSYDYEVCDGIVLYEWDFDDDGVYDVTGMVAYYTFTSSGDHDVTLRVTDGAGDTGTYTRTVTIWSEPPVADFDYDPYDPYWCDEVEFDASWSYDNDVCDSIVLYEWDFEDDGVYDASSTSVYAYYTFPTAGTYDVRLRVTDESGLTGTYLRTVNVISQPPVADFAVDDYYKYWCDQPFYFTDYSYDNDVCDSLSYDWDFGDGASSTEQNPSHTYASPGSYTVILTVTDDIGESDYYTDYVDVINEIPHADAAVLDDYLYWCDQPFDFHSGSDDPDYCGSLTYLWQFGDGWESTLEHPYHTYDNVGSYTVTLTVTDDFGETDTDTITVTVDNTYPYASFSWNPYTPFEYDSVIFTSSSYDSDPCDDIYSWEWDFGDGSPTSSLENPSHIYTTEGVYTVSLEVTDGYGWTDYTEEYIIVEVGT
jgi:PKD repeat protein